MIDLEADVVVMGAGPAGVCAAVAAARLGSKVILAGDRPVLGGNSSSEIRVWTRGATGAGNIFAEEMGTWGDFKMRNLYTNALGNPVLWDEVLLEAVLKEQNLKLLLNTHITDVEMSEDHEIKGVSGFQLSSEKRFRLRGKMFLDCTGDATIGAQAGINYRVGKESRDEYHEEFAPEHQEKSTLGSTIFYYTHIADHKVDFVPPDYAYSLERVEAMLGKGGRIVSETHNGCDYWWFEYGGTLDTIADAQEIALELKRFVMGVWNYIKNSGKYSADNLTLEWIGNIPGKRESRRMMTDYILTQNDILNETEFEDGAFYGGWYLDFHPSAGIFTSEEFCTQIPVKVYSVPLRCLYSSKVKNLVFAGRDIGATHAAFASTRIMNTCALSGQAAGTLASICASYATAPADMDDELIQTVRQTLLKEDMLVLGCRNSDTNDKAKTARITASSVAHGECTNEDGSFKLDDGGYLVIPSSISKIELLFNAPRSIHLEVAYHTSSIPSRMQYGKPQGTIPINLEAGKHWTSISLPEVDNKRFITLKFDSLQGIELITTADSRTGILGGHYDLPDYWFPCFKADVTKLFSAENVANGFSRPYNEPNLWISGSEEAPELLFEWETPQTIRELRLYLNSDLARELTSSRATEWNDHHKFMSRSGMPPQLVKDYAVYAQTAAGWQLIAVENNNWKRHSVVKLDEPIDTTALKFVFISTYGAPRAEVFEIRIY